MSDQFDVVVVGGGPGGYIAAIRASQLGKKVALVEREHLGGVCLNKGCIPTKAVLKSAHAVHEFKDLKDLGIDAELINLNGQKAVQRSKKIAERITKGVGLLMKKNKIKVYEGHASFVDQNTMEVALQSNDKIHLKSKNFIIATGANYRSFQGLNTMGKRKSVLGRPSS